MRVVKLKKMKRIGGVHFAPDGSRLLVCGGDEAQSVDVAVWVDVAKGEETGRVPLYADWYAVTPDLTRLALGNPRVMPDDQEAAVAFVDLTERTPNCRPFNLPAAAELVHVYGVAFSPDASQFAASYSVSAEGKFIIGDSFLAVWPLASSKKPPRVFDGIDAAVMAFDPTGKRLAGGCSDEGDATLHLFDLGTRAVRRFKPKGTRTRQLVYSPDGGTLAVVNGRNVYLLPADSTEPRLVLSGHPKQVNAVAFSPDGSRILSACHDKLVRVWDVASGELLHKYDWGLGAMTAITFAPDGLTAAAGGEKGQVVFWDVE